MKSSATVAAAFLLAAVRLVAQGRAPAADLVILTSQGAVPGTDFVAPLPGPLNKPCPSSVALLIVSTQPDAVRAMIAFMVSPAAGPILRTTHAEPAAR